MTFRNHPFRLPSNALPFGSRLNEIFAPLPAYCLLPTAYCFPAFLCLLVLLSATGRIWSAENSAAIDRRLQEDVTYLASDRLEGRGIGTAGIAEAAGYIRNRFRKLGLVSGTKDGSYFQPFGIRSGSKVIEDKTFLELLSPDGEGIELKRGKDYQPLAFAGDGEFEVPIVFAGYGITAEKLHYDDYKDINVQGKVVLILRREPQQDDPESIFDGNKITRHSYLKTKLQNAWAHKAAGILLVSDPFTTEKDGKDELMLPNYVPGDESIGVPLVHISQKIADELLAGTLLENVKEVEAAIDEKLHLVSQPRTGWSARGKFEFESVQVEARNVVGILEGEGPNSGETIVIGAHYDHLGFGEFGSLAPGSKQVHNGADDNASGTTVLMELAGRFAERDQKPSRRLVFIAFSGEERGLLGSRHYVKKDPLAELENTIVMINFDMVGRMRNEKLDIHGTKTAKEFEDLLDRIDPLHSLSVRKIGLGSRNSDHSSFLLAKIPALHFFTGTHRDYHKPSDDAEKINAKGMRQVADFAEAVIDEILAMPQRPEFVKLKPESPHGGMSLQEAGERPYLGTVPDYADEVKGALLNDISPGSPAEKGGLKPGDIVIDIDGTPIRSVQSYASTLFGHKPGQTIQITVLRDKEKLILKVTLGKRERSPKGR